MKMLRFETANCADFGRHLDAYVSGELLVEGSIAMLHHAASCDVCARLYRQRLMLRARLRDAVFRATESPPPELATRIRRNLRAMSGTLQSDA